MTNNRNLGSVALNYGLLLGVVIVILQIIPYAFGVYAVGGGSGSGKVYMYIGYLAYIVFPILALVKIKKSQGGFLTFGEGFVHSFLAMLYASALYLIWTLLYIYVLEPDYIEIAIEAARQEIIDSGMEMNEEAMDMALSMSRSFLSPGWIILANILYYAIGSAIGAIIYGAILQKKRPPHMEVSSEEFGKDLEK